MFVCLFSYSDTSGQLAQEANAATPGKRARGTPKRARDETAAGEALPEQSEAEKKAKQQEEPAHPL